MGLAAAACVVLGVRARVRRRWRVSCGRAATAPGAAPAVSAGHGFAQLAAVRGAISPALLALGLLGAVVGVLALWRATGAAVARRRAENWGCGRTLQTARMEYTATSFAEPLQRVFDDVLRPDLDVDVTHATESRWYRGVGPAIGRGCATASSGTSSFPMIAAVRRSASGRGRWATAACTVTSRTGSSRSVVVLVAAR